MSAETLNAPAPETHHFQAEIAQLLDIVIHSLYTDRDIFVRELISNAADALERFRHQTLVTPEISGKDDSLDIRITLDEEAKTFIIADNGDGMTRDQLTENLGTIAHSGTKSFLAKLAEGARKDVNLIGQFGVGFYSSFMVAKRVIVETRSYHPDSPGWRWESEGTGSYTISPAEGLSRGTTITIHLREEAEEFAKDWKVKEVIKRFSSFVSAPVFVNGSKVNTVGAIWARNRNEVSDEEYNDFFKFISNMTEEPLFRLHFTADAPLSINALIYAPKDNFERFGFGRMKAGVDLYCRKIMIMKHPEELLPEWMRFTRGVIDSEDLPLNISREMLQDNRLIQKLSKVITSKFVKFLAEQAEKEPEKFKEFYDKFHVFLKEGVTQDFTHRADLAKLLRFESSAMEADNVVSLTDYVSRMKDGQKAIYYINGPSRAAIEAGPYVEAFKERGIEVLYTHEAMDDFVMSSLAEFDGKALISADHDNIDLPEAPKVEGVEELSEEQATGLCEWLKEALAGRVGQVRASKRLVNSPAVAVTDGQMTSAMHRVMMAINKEKEQPVSSFVTLEINPRHPLVRRLQGLRLGDEVLAKDVASQLADNALLAAGLLTDPRDMFERLNRLLAKAAGA